ncbi:MAG: hypothetical protein AAF497_22910, partial [Planctomycetota bacterium]
DGHAHDAVDENETQFGIKHLLIWMLIISVALGLARVILTSIEATLPDRFDREQLTFTLILALSAPVTSLVVVWTAFVRRRMWLWLLIACGLLTVLSILSSVMLGMSEGFTVIVILSLPVCTFVAMLFLRLAGYRLSLGKTQDAYLQ